jgi:hypothetical protein
MEIKPTYVTFDQAKWLKEKRFEINTENVLFYTDEVNNLEEHQIKNRDVIYDGSLFYKVDENEYRTYEQWQVLEWLRINHGIWVEVNYGIYHAVKGTFSDTDLYGFYFTIKSIDEKDVYIFGDEEDIVNWFDSPQEAYSEAFDYVLNNLI